MKITSIRTVRMDDHPNLIHVLVDTDEGISGLGETYFGAKAVEAWIHETAAPRLLDEDPMRIEYLWTKLRPFLGFDSGGVETRGLSAIDIALWDILGKVAGLPIYQLLGGATREKIQIYNTCAGPRYLRDHSGGAGLTASNWGRPTESPHEDLEAFMNDAGALAQSLLDDGIRCMKIWPLDPFAEKTSGQYISDEDLEKGIEPFKKIREAVGMDMDFIVEMHGLWNLSSAKKIATALEPLQPKWFEDPIRMDNFLALSRFCDSTPIPVAASETLSMKASYQQMLEQCDIGVVIFDPAWVGGFTEGAKVAALAESYQVPIAPHDCSGPVEYAASVHMTINEPSAIYQESVRAFYDGWYPDLVTEVPRVENGYVYPLTGPGLGTELLPSVFERSDAHVRTSKNAN